MRSKYESTLALLFLPDIGKRKVMDNKNTDLIQLESEVEEVKEQEEVEGIPVCGAIFVSPVTHTTNFNRQVHYKIGTRLYIEKC